MVLLVGTGHLYQSTKARGDAKRFRPRGRAVDVGGYKLNINCAGYGSPTVILEAGLEVSAIGWRLVQPGIANFARVCSYDRAGYGWSDPGPMPRTSVQIARELHTLLSNAREQPPFVLVGHSFGGINVRIYNGLYPSEVVGMVLVEATQEYLKFPDSIQKLSDDDLKLRQKYRKWVRPVYWLGILRMQAAKWIDDPTASLEDQEESFFAIQPKSVEATTSEVENLQRDANDLRAAGNLGDKPLIVLTAGKGMFGLPVTSPDWVELRKRWVESHERLAELSTRGKRIMAPDAGHMIPVERPEAVISSVREVVTALNLAGPQRTLPRQ